MKYFFLISFVIISGLTFAKAAPSMIPVNLTTEYLVNPAGLDEKFPRFSWTFKTTDEKIFGQRQTAYRILVSTAANMLQRNTGDAWDSKWIASDNMQLIHTVALLCNLTGRTIGKSR